MTRSTKTKKHVPIPVKAVDFIMYSAKRMSPLRRWYEGTFGLPRGQEWHKGWSEFATKPTALCLNHLDSAEEAAVLTQKNGVIALAVSDISRAERACRRRKIPILLGPIETRVCRMLLIADPEGNQVILHQRKDGTAG